MQRRPLISVFSSPLIGSPHTASSSQSEWRIPNRTVGDWNAIGRGGERSTRVAALLDQICHQATIAVSVDGPEPFAIAVVENGLHALAPESARMEP